MSTIASLGIDLEGNAQPFVAAVQTARDSVSELKSYMTNIGLTLGGLAGGAASLHAFRKSDLGGSQEFADSIDAAQKSVVKLAAAFGEFLAPSAIFAANAVKSIADFAEPVLRKVSAFSRSASDFLMVLGKNILTAFRGLIPGLDAALKGGGDLWGQLTTGFDLAMVKIRASWNSFWSGFLEIAAPIIVGLTIVWQVASTAIAQAWQTTWKFISETAQKVLKAMGFDFQQTARGAHGVGGAIEDFIGKPLAALVFGSTHFKEIWNIALLEATSYVVDFGSAFVGIFTTILPKAIDFLSKYMAAALGEKFQGIIKGMAFAVENLIRKIEGKKEIPWKDFADIKFPVPPTPDFRIPKTPFQNELEESIKVLKAALSADWKIFLPDFLRKFHDKIEWFKNVIKFNLPDIKAIVPPDIAGKNTSQLAALEYGTVAAYSAQRGDQIAERHLKKTSRLVELAERRDRFNARRLVPQNNHIRGR